jgi:hypothetical protein
LLLLLLCWLVEAGDGRVRAHQGVTGSSRGGYANCACHWLMLLLGQPVMLVSGVQVLLHLLCCCVCVDGCRCQSLQSILPRTQACLVHWSLLGAVQLLLQQNVLATRGELATCQDEIKPKTCG